LRFREDGERILDRTREKEARRRNEGYEKKMRWKQKEATNVSKKTRRRRSNLRIVRRSTRTMR